MKTLGNLANENKRRDVLIITAINVILKVLSSSTSETDPIDYLPCTPVLEKLIAFSLPVCAEAINIRMKLLYFINEATLLLLSFMYGIACK